MTSFTWRPLCLPALTLTKLRAVYCIFEWVLPYPDGSTSAAPLRSQLVGPGDRDWSPGMYFFYVRKENKDKEKGKGGTNCWLVAELTHERLWLWKQLTKSIIMDIASAFVKGYTRREGEERWRSSSLSPSPCHLSPSPNKTNDEVEGN